MTMTMKEFAEARFKEIEERARQGWSSTIVVGETEFGALMGHGFPSELALEFIGSMREIAEIHSVPHECHTYSLMYEEMDNCYWVMEGEYCTTFRLLVRPFAGHPDYQEGWGPHE